MNESTPLVSIGIPTYNRERLIGRAIDSALQQDYPNIEIVISDNASTDATPEICRRYAQQQPRVRHIRQSRNLGATGNFDEVLQQSRGRYFMWLGDDDWLDSNYVSLALARLQVDPDIALVSGTPVYYVKSMHQGTGRVFNLLQRSALQRVLSYYWNVGDNGLFYGLMRRADVEHSKLPTFMGGDWVFVANVAARGKVVMMSETAVHRELGGATASYENIAKVLGLSRLHAMFPHFSIALNAFADIAFRGPTYRPYARPTRLVWASCAFACIILRASIDQSTRLAARLRNRLQRALAAASVLR